MSWRLQAFSSLWLRSSARVARFRPARGNLFQDLSILSGQVHAVSELLMCTRGLREAIDRWIMKLLGCQPLWQQQRLTVCSCHHVLARECSGFGILPNMLVRRIMGYVFPEADPAQSAVASALPPHATDTEAAIVFGHLLWSCPGQVWEAWCSTGVLIVGTLLTGCNEADVHHAGIILFALCGRLEREPIAGMNAKAVQLGHRLDSTASAQSGTSTGFMRHRISGAVEAAKRCCMEAKIKAATQIQAAWRGRCRK